MNGRVIGVITGIIVAIVIVLICSRFLNKDKSIKTKYDERQEIVRGKSYRIGFYAMSLALLLLLILESAEVVLPVSKMVLYFSVFFVGGAALCVHSILNEAYFGTNNKEKKWILYFIFFGIINLIVAVMAFIDGTMIVDGTIESPFINLECVLLLIVAFIALAMKKLVDGKEINDEES